MTEGSVWRHIVRFALPVFWGNLFQQLYNVVDSLVVGNFLGSDALAAVGSSSHLIFLLVGLFSGIFTGASVVISRYYGARDDAGVRTAVHTTVAFGLVAGVVITIAGVLLTPHLLIWMGTPESVLPNSILYFRIYFGGVIFVILYNTAAGIFQAVGDSRHPLYYLIVSSVVNVVLDLLFVAGFGMGVDGAALATVISQATSATLGFWRLCHTTGPYRIWFRKVRFHGRTLRQLLTLGIPSGVQNSIIAIANVVVQSSINLYGPMAMAGCGSYSKIEGFGFLPINSFALALATFIGQNLGAKQYDRARRGARFGILCSLMMAEVVGVGINLLAPWLISAVQRRSAGHRLRHAAGAHGYAVLLPAGLLALGGGRDARRGAGHRTHAGDAGVLVRHPRQLHHAGGARIRQYPDGVLGLSHHLGAQLRGLFDLFPARRLAALSGKERKGGLKGRPLRLTCPAA